MGQAGELVVITGGAVDPDPEAQTHPGSGSASALAPTSKHAPARLQCEFYLPHKRRRCGMTRQPAVRYCSEHLIKLTGSDHGPDSDLKAGNLRGNRVPCPLDPRHTVWERDVARHLRRCNRTKEQARSRALARDPDIAPWYSPGLNARAETSTRDDKPGSGHVSHVDPDTDTAAAAVCRAVHVLRHVYERRFPADQRDLPLEPKADGCVVDRRFPQLANRKHARQQASLIKHLKDNGLFPNAEAEGSEPITTFLEFGCGRAELSRYVCQSIALDSAAAAAAAKRAAPRFLLIDRASNRMKFDSKFGDDWAAIQAEVAASTVAAAASVVPAPDSPSITRKKVDIRDLRIDALLDEQMPGSCVAISKHLCGVATDLTIACVLNSDVLHRRHHKLGGMVIAMCCRHVCDPDQYANPSFIRGLIADEDISYPEFFLALKKIASWAVCGRLPGVPDSAVNSHFTGLPIVERERLGEMARRIIDEGRAQLLRDRGYHVSLVRYIEPEVSLENVAMIVRRA